jgi:hypothetical protein
MGHRALQMVAPMISDTPHGKLGQWLWYGISMSRTIITAANMYAQYYGFSSDIGPVYYGDDDSISPDTKMKIDQEVRS